MSLSKEEINRYSRQLLIPEFGIAAQEKLKKAKILVIGCGGLGSPILLYLAAAGVGTLGILDKDKVDESNLQRQILYGNESLGKLKVEETVKRLQSLNPFVHLNQYPLELSAENALEILGVYDLIIDGSDNFPTRYLVNDACVMLGKPFIYGAIYRFEGQLAIFNYKNCATYRDLFPQPPPPEMAPNCAESGVLGVLPGIIGSMQATEAIKLIAEIGDPLVGKMLLFDALSMQSRILKIPKSPDTPLITHLIDYEAFCNIKTNDYQEISAEDFLALQAQKNTHFQLIDVREPHEYEQRNLGGQLMPLAEIEQRITEIASDKMVIIYCQSGQRSLKAIRLLSEKYGFNNLVNLKGGIKSLAD